MKTPMALKKAIIKWKEPRWMKRLLNCGFDVDWILYAILAIARS